MGIFLKHLRLIPNILKWRKCKIFTKLAPSQTPSRSSHPRCSVKKDIKIKLKFFNYLKNLQNFTKRHLRWSLFQNLFKRDSNTDVFQWNLRNFHEHLFWRISANDCFVPSKDLQNLILTSSSGFHGDINFCKIT